MTDLKIVIPAGGHGRRLWPLSRPEKPKFLVDIGTGEPLIGDALRRALRVAGAADIHVVTGSAHAAGTMAVTTSYGLLPPVVEPFCRDTTAAVALGTFIAAQGGQDPIVVSLPADHLTRCADDGWEATVAAAAAEAARGRLVCVGVRPSSSHTGYGYVRTDGASAPGGARRVLAFREKPDQSTARAYVASGDYFWNTAIGAWRATTFADLLYRYAPDIAGAAETAAHAWHKVGRVPVDLWNDVRAVALEYALLEPSAADGFVSLVPASFQWSDVGSWSSVAEAIGEAVSSPHLLMEDSTNCVIHIDRSGGPRRYALLSVRDLIVVDTGDVVLVADRSAAERVKSLAIEADRQGWTGHG
jgi:mannose-1-phosphate guanylyltransferase